MRLVPAALAALVGFAVPVVASAQPYGYAPYIPYDDPYSNAPRGGYGGYAQYYDYPPPPPPPPYYSSGYYGSPQYAPQSYRWNGARSQYGHSTVIVRDRHHRSRDRHHGRRERARHHGERHH